MGTGHHFLRVQTTTALEALVALIGGIMRQDSLFFAMTLLLGQSTKKVK